MAGWAGVALALQGGGDDAMVSRVPAFLHPLAGRGLAWHVLQSMAILDPAPRHLFMVSDFAVDPSILGGLQAEALVADPAGGWWPVVADRLDGEVDRIMVVDAAAAALSRSLAGLAGGPAGRMLRDDAGHPLALWLSRDAVAAVRHPAQPGDLAAACREADPADPAEVFAVHDRRAMARANVMIRDRIVARHMEAGVTFLLPETVLVDVDVVIGADTVVYPGVVLEGQTSIGAETVVGPGCRIIDSRVGNGVELKGWNYLVGTSIRNRAVLEPYVRRGFD